MLDVLKKRSNSIFLLVGATVISTILAFTADMTGAGIATLVVRLLPIFIGVILIVLYFIWRYIHESSAWIGAILFALFLIGLGINMYWFIDYDM